MKAVIQRVNRASVAYDGILNKIDRGLVVLLGIGKNDSESDIGWLSGKILNLRIFPDAAGKFNYSVSDIKGDLLVISQFTLYADCQKGRRPDFTSAEIPDKAEKLYKKFLDVAAKSGLKIETGKFAADMLVEIHNDGPVTIVIDSKEHL